MIFLSGRGVKNRPDDEIGLSQGNVVERETAQILLVFFLYKTFAVFVREDHVAPALAFDADTRVAVRGPLGEAVSGGTEHAAHVGRVFTAAGFEHGARLETGDHRGAVVFVVRKARGRNVGVCKARIDVSAHGDVGLKVPTRENHALSRLHVEHLFTGFDADADDATGGVLINVGDFVFRENLHALLFAVGLQRHHHAAAAHEAAGGLGLTVAVARIVRVDVEIKLMVLAVVLSGGGCRREKLHAVGFEPFLRGAAVFRVLFDERGVVLLVFRVLGIGQVVVEAFRRILHVVFALPLRAALQGHDAAVDDRSAAVVLTLFKHDHFGAVVDRCGCSAHTGDTGTRDDHVRREIPLGGKLTKTGGGDGKSRGKETGEARCRSTG